MTMATMDHRNHVNMNPNSPDRKLPVEPNDVMVTPDRTVATTGTLSPEAHMSGLGQEIDGMITVVKDYVQASKGYSPTRNEFERTMEAIEKRAEEEEAEAARLEAEKAAQEVGFMDNLYSTFSFSGGASVTPSHHSATASQRGTVVHQMLKRLVVKELQSRRDGSATTIQSAVRRVLAKKRQQEMRVIVAERKRAEKELADREKYEQFSRKAASRDQSGNAVSVQEEEEVASEITTSKYSKMKSALKRLKRKKKKAASKAPLLPSIPESSPQEGADDMPIQENSTRKNKFWSKVKKMKKRSKSRKKKSSRRGQKAPVLDGVVEEEPPVYRPAEPRRIAVTITTTDDSIPTPEAEAEALEYQQRKLNLQNKKDTDSMASRSHASLNSTLPSEKDTYNNWKNFVLADDATSVTSARSRPLLDSWFKGFIFDKETLKEMDDDAIEEIVELALTSKELQKDLKIIPEINWTEDDWVDAKDSLFRCSQDHYEEVTYQTRRFVSNKVSL